MATFYPSLEIISKFKVQPTEGEWTLLNFLDETLDDSYEVYFNPYLNGDRPDVIIMREGNGVMVIEVKDWNLDNFCLNERRKWVYVPNSSIVKSPVDQVLKYKQNLYDLHIEQLLEKKINDIRHFNAVSCVVYFHRASHVDIEELIVNPYKEDWRYMNFLKYNIDFLGYDSLRKDYFSMILMKRYLTPSQYSFLFTKDIYKNFKRILAPSIHLKSQGKSYNYSKKQKSLIYSKTLEQRVKGVFGSGKTTVLAARAVQAYKRALERTNNPRILILTYNITLKNFIHDKLMMVEEEFPVQNFIIINYHSFINAELNNLGIEMLVPEDCPQELIGLYLENAYYSNKQLFEDNKDKIQKYDAVLIDEIQDYHRPWMEIIKDYYRDRQGDYVLFGDVKQNIYGQPIAQKDVVTNVLGSNELKYCYRSDFKVCDLARSFQEQIFQDKYEHDSFRDEDTENLLDLSVDKDGYINYMYLQNSSFMPALYNIIRGNILNKANNISPNDITILGCTSYRLRLFDSYYRYCSHERTKSMLETVEAMYMTHLNLMGKEIEKMDKWLSNIIKHLSRKMFPKRKDLYDNDFVKLRQTIARLFTVYDLYSAYSETFTAILNNECNACGISREAFLAFREYYKDDLQQFKDEVYNDDYKVIRDNKKLHFWMNSGTIKISTIHSFKGWESEVVFLIIEPNYNEQSFDELLYTGITRSRRNLIIINFGNEEYDSKIRPLIKEIK